MEKNLSLTQKGIIEKDITTNEGQIAESYDQTHGTGTSPAWNDVRKGLDWFRRYFAKEYMVLLD